MAFWVASRTCLWHQGGQLSCDVTGRACPGIQAKPAATRWHRHQAPTAVMGDPRLVALGSHNPPRSAAHHSTTASPAYITTASPPAAADNPVLTSTTAAEPHPTATTATTTSTLVKHHWPLWSLAKTADHYHKTWIIIPVIITDSVNPLNTRIKIYSLYIQRTSSSKKKLPFFHWMYQFRIVGYFREEMYVPL